MLSRFSFFTIFLIFIFTINVFPQNNKAKVMVLDTTKTFMIKKYANPNKELVKTNLIGMLKINFGYNLTPSDTLNPIRQSMLLSIAPNVDNTPLVRPSPLTTIKVDENFSTLDSINKTLSDSKFIITKQDDKDQYIEAKKRFSKNKDDYDKVLIWLERDFQYPDKFVKIFFEYGRYEKVWHEVVRIKMEENNESKDILDLKQNLISINKH